MTELENTNVKNNFNNGIGSVVTGNVETNLSDTSKMEVDNQTQGQDIDVSKIEYEDTHDNEELSKQPADSVENSQIIQIPEIPQDENNGNSESENQPNADNEMMVSIPNLSDNTTSFDNQSNSSTLGSVSESVTSSLGASDSNQQETSNISQDEAKPTISGTANESSVINTESQVQNTKNEQQEKLIKIIKLREGKAKKAGFSMGILTGIVVVAMIGALSFVFAKDQIINLLQNGLGNNSGLSANIVDLKDDSQVNDENLDIDENTIDGEDMENVEDIALDENNLDDQGDSESQLREFYLDQLNNILAMGYDNQSTLKLLNELLQKIESQENPDQELISLIMGEIEYYEAEESEDDSSFEYDEVETQETIKNIDEGNQTNNDNTEDKNTEDKNTDNKNDSQQNDKSENNEENSSNESEISNEGEIINSSNTEDASDEGSSKEEIVNNKELTNDNKSSDSASIDSQGNTKTPEEIQDNNENKQDTKKSDDGMITYSHVDNIESANRVMSPNCSTLSCGDYTQIKKENLVLCTSFQLKEDMDDSSHRISNSGVCRYRDLSELVHLDL